MKRAIVILALLLALTGVGAVGFHLTGDQPWLESLYLAIITLTTLGSRDPGPSSGVMVFTILYLLCGLSIFTYSAYQLGHFVLNAEIRKMLERRRMERNIRKLENHYIVCGMGRMGTTICEFLSQRRKPFVVIDTDAEKVEQVCLERGWYAIEGDATDDSVLKAAGIERAQGLATVLATDADNVYVVLTARMLSTDLQIVARTSDDKAIQKMERAGATRVISPFSSGAVKMARFMLSPSIEDFLEITDSGGSELELADIQIDADSPYVGRKLMDTDLRDKGVMIIGIRRASGERLLPPSGAAIIEPGDSLFAFGSSEAVNSMIAPHGNNG